MPVSRKRKKSKKSSGGPGRRVAVSVGDGAVLQFGGMSGHRARLDAQRVKRALVPAASLVADLAVLARQPDVNLEDELCARLGPLLAELGDGPVEKYIGPDQLMEALVTAAADPVRRALLDGSDYGDAWRVFGAVAGIAPGPLRDLVAARVKELRAVGLPFTEPATPVLVGEIRWVRDRYGSRFGITAPFAVAGAGERWYLWDIDGCVFQPVTVHSGYYGTAEAALVDWRSGVGAFGAGDADWSAMDDHLVLADLLPQPEGMMAMGGESVAQYAEYHRSRQLAEQLLERSEVEEPYPAVLVPEQAAGEFVTWLAERGQAGADDVDEVALELAQSWPNEALTIYGTFSPHRVAHTVRHVRNFYLDDFADDVVNLLPAWITWLAGRTGTAPELVERSLAYASGQPHPQVGSEDREPDYRARVPE